MVRAPLCSAILLVVLLAVSAPSFGQVEPVDAGRSGVAGQAQVDRDAAGWAEQEAQRRATDGDYDGAVQAHQQAEQDSREADAPGATEGSGR